MRTFIDIVAEEIQAPMVFHSTEFGPEIIADGEILANSTIDLSNLNGKATDVRFDDTHHEAKGVCVTRSFYFARQFSDVIFGIDLRKLKSRFRVVQRAETGAYDLADDHGDFRIEAEEFVICPGIDTDRYVTSIWMSEERRGDEEFAAIVADPRFAGYFRQP